VPRVRLHYDDAAAFADPHVWVWYPASTAGGQDVGAAGRDDWGPFFDLDVGRPVFSCKFKDGPGPDARWEVGDRDRTATVPPGAEPEVWAVDRNAFVYRVEPASPEAQPAESCLRDLGFAYDPSRRPWAALGATPVGDGLTLFGFYHPTAAQISVIGDFNGWDPQPLRRFVDVHGLPALWLAGLPAGVGDEYRFLIEGGTLSGGPESDARSSTDPFARQLGPDYDKNNAVVVDPAALGGPDPGWRTPAPPDLVLYELSPYGFTEGDPDIPPAERGTFRGMTQRIEAGHFDQLRVTALSLMPLAETPSPQGPTTLGYNPSLWTTVERDFGTPGDLRELVRTAHDHGLALLLDQVFNHTDSGFNPLWGLVLEQPADDRGIYFDGGSTPWGNHVATWRSIVQEHLIEVCHRALGEYGVDGFRFDATHSWFMDHDFLRRLAADLKASRPDVLLVAENLPNEADLNLAGFDGYAQWCDGFHDGVKELLTERRRDLDGLGDAFYFSKRRFAAHTNNVVNYVVSHDEDSVPAALQDTPMRDNAAAKDRKGRLGLFATLVALGQPMLFMGQEFNALQPRNVVTVDWPHDAARNPFFIWAAGVVALRRDNPGLHMDGYDPATDGRFAWILGPWMDGSHGGGHATVGWRARPDADPEHDLVVLLNFEPYEIRVDLEFKRAGTWRKLADLDRVTDGSDNATALDSRDGRFAGFTLPSSSGFVYRFSG
jgi:1,4-alpha-glucan branching enzyme